MVIPDDESCAMCPKHVQTTQNINIVLQLSDMHDLPLQRFQFDITVIKYRNESYLTKHKLLIASPTVCQHYLTFH
jgi:hypothetical protein